MCSTSQISLSGTSKLQKQLERIATKISLTERSYPNRVNLKEICVRVCQ